MLALLNLLPDNSSQKGLMSPLTSRQRSKHEIDSLVPLVCKRKRKSITLKQHVLNFFLWIAAFWILMTPAIAMPFYDLLLFHPDRNDHLKVVGNVHRQFKEELNVDFKQVWFKAPDGSRVNAWYYSLPGAKKIALISHGNGGNNAHRAIISAILLTHGLSVLVYDYEGYGKSEGKPSVKHIVQDGISAYDYIRNNLKFRPSQIVLLGESLGTGVSCQIAAQRQCAGIILESGYARLMEAGRDAVPWLWWYPHDWFDDLDSIAVLKKAHAPVLIIHGDNDSILNVEYSRRLYAEAVEPKKLVIVHNMLHCVSDLDNKVFNDSVGNFLKTL